MSGKRCDAVVMLLGVIDLGRCTSREATRFTGTCGHGHTKKRWLCAEHGRVPEAAMCRVCFELPGAEAHECAVTITPATEEAAR